MASAKQLFEPKRMLLDRGERTLIRHMRDPKEGMYTVILEYSIGAGPNFTMTSYVDALDWKDAVKLADEENTEKFGSSGGTMSIVAVFAGEHRELSGR